MRDNERWAGIRKQSHPKERRDRGRVARRAGAAFRAVGLPDLRAAAVTRPPANGHNSATCCGNRDKGPSFLQVYTGPKWSELNAVKASAKLSRSGNFTFTGTNAVQINKGPAVYVWGIDRSGNLSAGPFTGRPNIKFDAVVIVSLDSSLTATAKVVDLSSGVTTVLPAGLGEHSRAHGHGARSPGACCLRRA